MIEVAKKLVKESIKGERKGSDEAAYIHSWRVGEKLSEHGFSEEVVMAGILHDVIEDSEVTYDDLRELGFSEEIISLVDLSSHDENLPSSDLRWFMIFARLIEVGETEAWNIKLADLMDNLGTCHTMPDDRRRFMRLSKGPMLRNISKQYAKESLWQEFADVVESGIDEEIKKSA